MSNFFGALSNFLKPAQPKYPADSLTEPAQITRSKVLLIVYDPIMDNSTGAVLSKQQSWYRTADLVNSFMADLLQVSSGLARYEIVQRVDLNEFPAKTDGFRYTPQTFMNVWGGTAPKHMPQEVDYYAIINQFNILQRVARNEIDEVWIFGFPHAGFYESIMGGPGAFWCNAPALTKTDTSKRRFVIMGFSYERIDHGKNVQQIGRRCKSMEAFHAI
jgi:hypothetical protein